MWTTAALYCQCCFGSHRFGALLHFSASRRIRAWYRHVFNRYWQKTAPYQVERWTSVCEGVQATAQFDLLTCKWTTWEAGKVSCRFCSVSSPGTRSSRISTYRLKTCAITSAEQARVVSAELHSTPIVASACATRLGHFRTGAWITSHTSLVTPAHRRNHRPLWGCRRNRKQRCHWDRGISAALRSRPPYVLVIITSTIKDKTQTTASSLHNL